MQDLPRKHADAGPGLGLGAVELDQIADPTRAGAERFISVQIKINGPVVVLNDCVEVAVRTGFEQQAVQRRFVVVEFDIQGNIAVCIGIFAL